jgi:murein DD-endopeptidase MepM/ murein hydrolase activator NlpD
MRKPFDGEYIQTQGFNDPCCQASYKQFGMKGHNGLDFATPSGTKILAPHDGKVIESTLDPAGYGIYVKIENSVEGSVLAHLREARVGVGDGVKEGDLIGYSDNSGNSTGPHLHWGYYRFPRDRANGFAGFIDQTPYIGTGTPNLDQQKQLDECRIDRDGNHNDRMALYEELGFTGVFNRTVAVEKIKQLLALEKSFVLKDEQLKKTQDELTAVRGQLQIVTDSHDALQTSYNDLQKEFTTEKATIDTLNTKLIDLEAMIKAPVRLGWKARLVAFIDRI